MWALNHSPRSRSVYFMVKCLIFPPQVSLLVFTHRHTHTWQQLDAFRHVDTVKMIC